MTPQNDAAADSDAAVEVDTTTNSAADTRGLPTLPAMILAMTGLHWMNLIERYRSPCSPSSCGPTNFEICLRIFFSLYTTYHKSALT